MRDDRIRLEIAFEGGQTIAALVTPTALDALRQALAGDRNGVVELEAEDGAYVVPVRAVVYVKRFARETHIGFGRTR